MHSWHTAFVIKNVDRKKRERKRANIKTHTLRSKLMIDILIVNRMCVRACACNDFLPDAHRKSGFIQIIVQPLGTGIRTTANVI